MTVLLHNFSPTQVEAFTTNCKRYWYLRWVMRKKVPEQEYQKFGKQVHKAIEVKIDPKITVEVPLPSETELFVRAVEQHLPPPDEDDVQTELNVELSTHLGIPWFGVIDLLRPSARPIVLRDWKTTSDFRYAKTPQELRRDIQLCSYAEFVFQLYEEHGEDHGGVIDAGLIYIKTESKKEREKRQKRESDSKNKNKSKPQKIPKVLPVITELSRETVGAVWDSTRPILDEMVEVAQCTDFNDVTPTTTSCDRGFGGCPFRVDCGLEPKAPGLYKKEKDKTVPSFLDKLKNQTKNSNGQPPATTPEAATPQTVNPPRVVLPEEKAAAQAVPRGPEPAPVKTGFLAKARGQATTPAAATAPTPTPVEAGPPPESAAPRDSIVPHDAPPRDSKAPLEAGDPGVKKTAADASDAELAAQDDANIEAEAASGKKRPGRKPKGTATEKTNGKREFVLFIDTIMVKGGGDIEPTSLEDWFSPISMQLDDAVKADNNLPSWWLLPFAEQKAALAIVVQESIAKGLPPAMMVSSSSAITRDLLPMLLPHATQVYKSLRG